MINSKFEQLIDVARDVMANPVSAYQRKALAEAMTAMSRDLFQAYAPTDAARAMFGAIYDVLSLFVSAPNIHAKHMLHVGLKPMLEMIVLEALLSDADARTQLKGQKERKAALAKAEAEKEAATRAAFENSLPYKDQD